MKKTDVTQPVAMATPFAEGVYSATSTEDFEIPAVTSTTADDSCVMDNGFLPITSTALDDGGKAPERKNFNGMFYLSTDQRFFLQNGGFITYNPDVAAAIGGYPQDAILDFIDSNGTYKKVRSLIDDNSNNFVADETLIDGTNWEEIQMGGGSGYEVGDIVIRNTPTNDAGKHLLDGALIQYGSYQAFVDYIADLYNNTPAENVYNVNIVGSLTNDNGVLSGFAGGVYATIKEVPYSTADSIEILLKTTTGTLDSTNYNCFYSPIISNFRGVDLQINPDNKIQLYVSSNAGSSWDIANGVVGTTVLQSNTQYYFKYVYTGTNHILYMSTTGAFAGEETTEVDVTNSSKPSNSAISLGLQAWSTNLNNYWRGTIDLNESYININGKRWWSGKSERRAGFLTEDEWQATVTNNGVCSEFVYNSVNNTVRLPKYGNQLLTKESSFSNASTVPVRGNGLTIGMYNGGGTFGVVNNNGILRPNPKRYNTSVGTAYSGDVSSNTSSVGVTTDERYSGIVANTSNVSTLTEYPIDVYYYIVIANSTKTDIQVNIDEIATDLNGKADVDLTNVNNSGTSRGAGWAMPSSTYVGLTLGATNTFYIAPANGWFAVGKASTGTGQWMSIVNDTSGIIVSSLSGSAGSECYLYMPCLSGDKCYVNYNLGGVVKFFRFVYAKGSESEAN